MGCFDLLVLFLCTILIILIWGFRTAQSTYVHHFCLGSNYTANSVYQTNLKNLLSSSLSSSNTININIKNGYYFATVGHSRNIVYGSFQCRGDIKLEVCQQECVDNAAKEIIERWCPNSKEAIVWYHKCMLRYSNRPYFSIMENKPSNISVWNHVNNENPHQFNRILAGLVDDLVRQAISGSPNNTLLFATGERNYSSTSNDDDDKKIYGLVQCTSDISQSSCNTCLRGVNSDIKRYCYGKRGAQLVRPSCFFRYDTNSFYLPKVTADESPSLTPHLVTKMNMTLSKTKRMNLSKVLVIVVVPSVFITVVLSTITIWYCCLQRTKEEKKMDDVDEIRSAESFQFNFSTIRAATDNFSDANKLGQGGFGSVYKGKLSDGQDIAVKRLSKNSGQGEEEFKNEVALVVKLQHRNLVRLLGFCLDGEERLLIYEFMSNTSLDQFIFDQIKRKYLDWERRYKIIGGIARGLLYLHEDSRLRIIHRDLKASNVLLGEDMNPKISDFGMARSFMVGQTQASTNRIVGTYGYMAPEYAMHGHFSAKSDVFSFGVLVLEIISGRRNNSFFKSEGDQDLLSYAWRHWKNGTVLE